ncbi:MAG: Exodeoxyribonuclease 7 large subunit [Candidatus Aerophobetes bacterium ADurb.Bin490]|nr:MAG: Exodeoxyribonuclease 7 large subunit [Candidatus Aerophobetes bacterium ADurb.Bin490]HNZ28856.1 exodeoxyribonuclease VII large subunit [Candidatus Goldiibacteriota bacterium]HPN64550.1 exodeoxyribonuclease VII large subunit [Candidatus Goldiibacteriota bacterium]HRQ44242.1 exodeoxyribonuclease VII large subunit [Candidatus Goldiibacteriota bacterium]
MPAPEDRILTVSEVSVIVKELLEGGLNNVWIKGEISNYSTPSSGHVYFTLKDNDNQIKVAYFRGASKCNKLGIEDGKEIMVFGRVSAYGKRSEYQLIASEIQVTGVGALLVEFEKLKKKLSDKGLFKEEHKREIPYPPNRIAIVTSPSGAAIRDVIKILKKRYNGLYVLVYPALMQGDEAPKQIINAIKDINEQGGFDVILLTRGGGSMEDLWAFNDENLAYAIYESEIPVISAVGHEIDFTIADFTADRRAPTPSGAAEMLVPDKEEILHRITVIKDRIASSLESIVSLGEERLLKLMQRYGFKMPFKIYEESSRTLDDLKEQMKKALSGSVDETGAELKLLKEKLQLLNPLAVLKKGYSVVYDSSTGKVVTDAAALKAGDNLDIKTYKGRIAAKVSGIKKGV